MFSSDGSTCPSGFSRITSSLDDCKCAVGALGYSSSIITTETYSSYEKGCYRLNSGGTFDFYFNYHATGGSIGTPLCKKNGRRALRRDLSDLSHRIRSDCDAGVHMSKAGFAMLFLGLLCSCVLLASFTTATGYATFPSPLGKQMPSVAIGVMSIVFLLPGVICAAEYPDKFMDWFFTLMDIAAAAVNNPIDREKIEWAMIMLILAPISVFVATVMAYVGIDANDDGDTTTAAASTEVPMAVPMGVGAPPVVATAITVHTALPPALPISQMDESTVRAELEQDNIAPDRVAALQGRLQQLECPQKDV